MKYRYDSQRFGWFVISGIFIVNHPDVVKQIMGRCIIVHAAPEPHYDAIKYQAISDDFTEVKIGNLIPEYEMVVEKDPDGNATFVQFRKI